MITLKCQGSFKRTINFVNNAKNVVSLKQLDAYGQRGVDALAAATPRDTGKTAESWYYKIRRNPNWVSIEFFNSNRVNDVPIAIILQYGHATRNGGYVQGRDYINPAIVPVFDKIASELWGEVNK